MTMNLIDVSQKGEFPRFLDALKRDVFQPAIRLLPGQSLKERLNQFFNNTGLVKYEEKRIKFKPEIARIYKAPYGWHLIIGLYPGISIDNLRQQRSALNYACQGETSIHQDNSGWTHIRVFTRSLPNKINYFNWVIERVKKYPLALPVGISRQGMEYIKAWKDTEFSGFIPGESGGGKTVFLRQMLLTVVLAYSPARVLLYLIDMKDGNELNLFQYCPHTKAFAGEIHGAKKVIQAVRAETKKRSEKFKSLSVPNIQEYNKKAKDKLPRILFVIDEVADFSGDSRSLTPEQMDINEICRKGRSYGVHTIISVQKPTADQLPTAIRFNLATTVCFRMQNELNSTLALGKDFPFAAYIETPGRAFFQKGFTKEIQVPFITYDSAKAMIEKKYPETAREKHINNVVQLADLIP